MPAKKPQLQRRHYEMIAECLAEALPEGQPFVLYGGFIELFAEALAARNPNMDLERFMDYVFERKAQ